MSNEDLILEVLEECYKKTGGACGVTIVNASHESGLPVSEVKKIARKLYHDDIIKPADSIHGVMMMLNKPIVSEFK